MIELTGRLMMSPDQILEFGRLTDAAQRGDGAAACRLGDMHREGKGGLRYSPRSFHHWYSRSALAGDAGGQNNLGACYEHGLGCEQSFTSAVKWYKLAAAQRLGTASMNLGYCFMHGHGVPPDKGEALRLFRLAVEQGEEKARPEVERLATTMTKSKIRYVDKTVPEYRMLKANDAGRDFVVGDVHGMFDRVAEALSKADFDRDRDRLFSVGDLIDRGQQSREVVRFLDQPFVHAVCGNHEDALLQMHAGSSQPNSETWLEGADWWHELSKADRRAVVSRLKRLPLVIEVPTPRGNVAFLHADVPRGMNWSDFRAALKSEPETVRQTVLWGRGRIGRADGSGVPGIGRVFVGHTPQWDGLRRYGNVYAIDTGAVFGWRGMDGHLTCVNIQSSTEGLLELHQVGTLGVDVVDLPAPDRPFGSYAKLSPWMG